MLAGPREILGQVSYSRVRNPDPDHERPLIFPRQRAFTEIHSVGIRVAKQLRFERGYL